MVRFLIYWKIVIYRAGTRRKSSKKSPLFFGNTSPVPARPVFWDFDKPVSTFTTWDFQSSAYRWYPLPIMSDFDNLVWQDLWILPGSKYLGVIINFRTDRVKHSLVSRQWHPLSIEHCGRLCEPSRPPKPRNLLAERVQSSLSRAYNLSFTRYNGFRGACLKPYWWSPQAVVGKKWKSTTYWYYTKYLARLFVNDFI